MIKAFTYINKLIILGILTTGLNLPLHSMPEKQLLEQHLAPQSDISENTDRYLEAFEVDYDAEFEKTRAFIILKKSLIKRLWTLRNKTGKTPVQRSLGGILGRIAPTLKKITHIMHYSADKARETPKIIKYHNALHFNELIELIYGVLLSENVPIAPQNKIKMGELAGIAILFHDIGYYTAAELDHIKVGKDGTHEDRGKHAIVHYQKKLGLSDRETEFIKLMIELTKFQLQKPDWGGYFGDQVTQLAQIRETILKGEEVTEEDKKLLQEAFNINLNKLGALNREFADAIFVAITTGIGDLYAQNENYLNLVPGLHLEFKSDKDNGAQWTMLQQIGESYNFFKYFAEPLRLNYLFEAVPVQKYVPGLTKRREENFGKMKNVLDWTNAIREGKKELQDEGGQSYSPLEKLKSFLDTMQISSEMRVILEIELDSMRFEGIGNRAILEDKDIVKARLAYEAALKKAREAESLVIANLGRKVPAEEKKLNFKEHLGAWGNRVQMLEDIHGLMTQMVFSKVLSSPMDIVRIKANTLYQKPSGAYHFNEKAFDALESLIGRLHTQEMQKRSA